MNEILKKYFERLKNPKILIAVGVFAILLIFISSFTDNKSKSEKSAASSAKITISAEEYRTRLESEVSKIVKGITGDKSPTVVVTLESGIRYDYAGSFDESSSNSSGANSNNESSSSSKTYITFRNSDGGEEPLIIAEIMPQIRGVAVVCTSYVSEETAEKIKNAVTAALDITSKRVYITGGSIYEKR